MPSSTQSAAEGGSRLLRQEAEGTREGTGVGAGGRDVASHPLPDYAGTFEHPGYGVVRITHENGALVFALDQVTGPLEHFHYDVFRPVKGGTRSPIDDARLTFANGANGKVASVSIPLEPAASEIVFKRQPAAKPASSQ